MSKVTMPEPVAWVRRHPDGALTAEFLENAAIESVRKQSGAWLPMVTTAQAKAYKDACVREVLEEAANIAKAVSDKYAFGYYGNEVDTADEIEAGIRALIK